MQNAYNIIDVFEDAGDFDLRKTIFFNSENVLDDDDDDDFEDDDDDDDDD